VLLSENVMDATSDIHATSAADFVHLLQGRGRYTFTLADARAALRATDVAIDAALRRLKRRGRIVSPRRGFFVVVPAEYAESGAPPATWFIDELMRFLDQPYYVGLLSAAALHGAAHQQPMVFQVVTDRPTRPIVVGRTRIDFHVSRTVDAAAVSAVQTDAGYMRVSDPETTALDLVRYMAACGGLGNVATVVAELSERLDPLVLSRVAAGAKAPDVQRLGFLLQVMRESSLADALHSSISVRRFRPVLLVPSRGASPARRQADGRWRVVMNESIEVDL
jgi:predicted transcriptional regulator of viral defense system